MLENEILILEVYLGSSTSLGRWINGMEIGIRRKSEPISKQNLLNLLKKTGDFDCFSNIPEEQTVQ